jgi:hypothetical protein
MMNRCDVHQFSHPCSNFTVSSGAQSDTQNVLATMRVPGGNARNFGTSFSMLVGRRNSARTVAFEMSAAYMSPWANIALSPTPCAAACRFEYSTSSGLNSTPSPRAPRLAAAMMVRPSPDPRSITKSCGVTLA